MRENKRVLAPGNPVHDGAGTRGKVIAASTITLMRDTKGQPYYVEGVLVDWMPHLGPLEEAE